MDRQKLAAVHVHELDGVPELDWLPTLGQVRRRVLVVLVLLALRERVQLRVDALRRRSRCRRRRCRGAGPGSRARRVDRVRGEVGRHLPDVLVQLLCGAVLVGAANAPHAPVHAVRAALNQPYFAIENPLGSDQTALGGLHRQPHMVAVRDGSAAAPDVASSATNGAGPSPLFAHRFHTRGTPIMRNTAGRA